MCIDIAVYKHSSAFVLTSTMCHAFVTEKQFGHGGPSHDLNTIHNWFLTELDMPEPSADQ